jgi:hypothetical protein
VFVGVRVTLLPPPDTYLVEPSRYLLKELVSRAFGSLALPWTPADMKDLPFAAIFPWAAVAGLLLYRLTSGLPRPALANASMLLVWVIVSVLPVYSYFYVAPTLEGSRYLYLGTAAFSILIAQLAATRSAPGLESGGVIVLILIVGFSAIGVRRHQSAWLEAAAIRNAVLGAASDTLSTANCDSVAVKELPDSHNGAYVFRNGFAEALRAHGIPTPPLASESAACSYAWTGAQFTRER